LKGAFRRVWPWHAIACAAPLPGRRQTRKIAIEIVGQGGQIGGIVEAGQRCNWACGRYSPRRFRWPKPGRRRGRARADSTKDAEMLVTPALAQASSPFGGDSLWVQLLPFVLIFVIMYFLILRPQQKRAKEHQELIKNLRRGDTVITSGGLVGKVTKVVDDDQIEVEIADGVRVRQVRAMVSGVRAKGEPVKDDGS
jgi:preprotein translocase subunit YajC